MSDWDSTKFFIPPRKKKNQAEVKKEETTASNSANTTEEPTTSESSNIKTEQPTVNGVSNAERRTPTTSDSSPVKQEKPTTNESTPVKQEKPTASESIPVKQEKPTTSESSSTTQPSAAQAEQPVKTEQNNIVKTERTEPSLATAQTKDKGKQPEKTVVLHEVKPASPAEDSRSNEAITSSKHFHDMFNRVIKLALDPKSIEDQLKQSGNSDPEQIQRISRAALDVVTTVLQSGPQASQIKQVPNFEKVAAVAAAAQSQPTQKMTIAEAIQAFINVLPKPATTTKPTAPKPSNKLQESVDTLQESLSRLNIPVNTPPTPGHVRPPNGYPTPPPSGYPTPPNAYPTPPNGYQVPPGMPPPPQQFYGQPPYVWPMPPNGYAPQPGYPPPPHGFYPMPPQMQPGTPPNQVPRPQAPPPQVPLKQAPPNQVPRPQQVPLKQAPPPTKAATTASSSKKTAKKRKTIPEQPRPLPTQFTPAPQNTTWLPPQTPTSARPANQQPVYPAQPSTAQQTTVPVFRGSVKQTARRPVLQPSQAATTATKQTARRPATQNPFAALPARATAPQQPVKGSPFLPNNARPSTSAPPPRPTTTPPNRPPTASTSTAPNVPPQPSTSAVPSVGAEKTTAQWLVEAGQYFLGAKKERVKRAIQQSIYVLSRALDPDDDSVEKFEVIGSIGNTYTVTMGITMSCTCPDYQDRYIHCKHILTILIKVYHLPFGDNMYHTLSTTKYSRINARSSGRRVDPSVLIPEHARRRIANIRQGAAQSAQQEVQRKPLESSNCPVCYERFTKAQAVDVIYCKTCGSNVHGVCFKRANQARGGDAICMVCKAKWIYQNTLPSGSRPPLDEAHMYEGRPNFAKELGISRERDTSTYKNNDFWSGNYRKRKYWGRSRCDYDSEDECDDSEDDDRDDDLDEIYGLMGRGGFF